jgi:hypothetical protein
MIDRLIQVIIFITVLMATAALLTSCGKQEVEVKGKVQVEGSVDLMFQLSDLKTYFNYECQTKVSGDKCYNTTIQTCVDCLTNDFYSHI